MRKKEVKMDIQAKKLDTIVSFLQKKNAKIAFFVGAGISTNCGIPDFRSPETGLYSNLKKLNLPYPEAVFDIEYFRKKPKAFYTLADELFPGKFVPSKFHYFIKLCDDKGLLKRCYTQNIDTLERIAGVSDDKVLEAHGSFSANHCIDCNNEMIKETLREYMDKNEIPTCSRCKGYVKPDIVFFGESLPEKMWEYWEEDIDDVDLAIVAGTSLAVYPFASLPSEVSNKCKRILINREVCGDFESNPRKTDIILQNDCDSIAELLCEKLGWTKELEKLLEAGTLKIHSKKKFKSETATELSKEIAEEIAPDLEEEEQEEVEDKKMESRKKEDVDLDALTEGVHNIKIT
ncbi:Sir2 histone deacetylase Hst2 [Pichia californica]|uniref:NAD-dependent protein deacetylase n=1 Tax=Pichia californica TaxID=460514 RepID=A0A9P6WL01_9ASCO|nr:Sir2 histone deacetylase Hst2 [[Candida] californica]